MPTVGMYARLNRCSERGRTASLFVIQPLQPVESAATVTTVASGVAVRRDGGAALVMGGAEKRRARGAHSGG